MAIHLARDGVGTGTIQFADKQRISHMPITKLATTAL